MWTTSARERPCLKDQTFNVQLAGTILPFSLNVKEVIIYLYFVEENISIGLLNKIAF